MPEMITNTLMTTKLVMRQNEIYCSSSMNMHGDILANTPVLVDERLESFSNEEAFWYKFLTKSAFVDVEDDETAEVEAKIIAGIPDEVRSVFYLRLMLINSSMDTTMYNGIMKKAKLAHWIDSQIEWESFSENSREALQVFHYCVVEIVKSTMLETNYRVFKFIASAAQKLTGLPTLTKSEILAILLKFYDLLNGLSKDEFCYKASRSLEENVPEAFSHISRQGIDLTGFYKTVLFNVLSMEGSDVSVKILDLVVFEGFDFLHRLITALFQEKERTILELMGDLLYDYIYSSQFLEDIQVSTISQAFQVSPAFVRYENEFNLMNVNAISGNQCELANLKDAHEDLQYSSREITQRIESLCKTEAEFSSQLEEVTAELASAQAERESLRDRANELREKYAQLTMNENLTNLVKANREISSENNDLSEQIAQLEKSIEAKTAKLKKKAPQI